MDASSAPARARSAWIRLDLRHFTGFPSHSLDPSIEWSNPGQELDALIFGGEGSRLELTAVLPGSTREETRGFLKTVVASANGSGGTIVFGVNNDNIPVGLVVPSEDKAKLRLTSMISDAIDPPPRFDIRTFRHDDLPVFAVEVQGSTSIHSLFRDKPEFYIRRSGSTFRAVREEVIDLVNARAAARLRGGFNL